MPSAVTLRAIRKGYGAVRAVDDLSLDIEEGEVFALLGPSGCGKTTTLRMIAGLETPDDGDILFGGRPIVVSRDCILVPANKRNIGMVFQSYAIWPHMTVRENVAFPLRVRRVKAAETDRRVSDTLALVGLGGYEERLATRLSGGQQQRVALARALVYEPTVLLLDEPFSNLDAKLRDQLRLELKLLQRRLGITVIFVTHDQTEALSLADRLAVLANGGLEQIGRPLDLYLTPATSFVRDFIGRTIMLRGVMHERGGAGGVRMSVAGTPGILAGALDRNAAVAAGAGLFAACRPEDVELIADDGAAMGDNLLIAHVEAVLFTGERNEVSLRFGELGRGIAYAPRRTPLEIGQAVRVRFAADAITFWSAGPQ